MASKPPSEAENHVGDKWTMAQRWDRAIAKAQAGERRELAHMVVYEGPIPASLREEVLLILENPRPTPTIGKKAADDEMARYVRYKVQLDLRARKPMSVIEDEILRTLGIKPRTVREIVAERGAYARRRWRRQSVFKT